MTFYQRIHCWFISICLFVVPLIYFPFLSHAFIQGKELTFKFLILLAIFGISLLFAIKKKLILKRFWENDLAKILGLLFFVYFAATVFSPNPIIAIYGSYTRGFGFIVLIFVAVWFVFNVAFLQKETIKKALTFSYLSALLIALYAIVQMFGFNPLFGDFQAFLKRSFGFIGNPSLLGQFLTLEFIIGIYLFTDTKNSFKRIILALSLLVILGGLLTSETRIAIVALFIGFILLTVKYFRETPAEKKRKILLASGFIITIVVFVLFKFFGTFSNENRFDFSQLSIRSLSSRLEIWKAAVELIRERPILGYGMETFSTYFPDKVSKAFFTLEEGLNISADRIHNEFLEVIFSSGIIAGLIYIFLIGFIVYRFFKTKDRLLLYLYLLILVNFIQNQMAFPDINITVLVIFCLAAIASLEIEKSSTISFKPYLAYIQFATIFIIVTFSFYSTILIPLQSHLYYTQSKQYRQISYDIAVLSLKNATALTPHYSQLWYEVLFIDASSMPRALHYLEQIEGATGDVLAWKANYYSLLDSELAHRYFKLLLQRNPNHPNWTRAYADSLYRNGQHEKALVMYKKYLELVPDFWKWKDELQEKTPEEQKSYRIFFKNVPDFWSIVERVKKLEEQI